MDATENATKLLSEKLKDKENQIKVRMLRFPILILGDYNNICLLDSIKERIQNEGLLVWIIKELAPQSKMMLPDYEIEKTIMKDARIIVMIDGEKPGTVSESCIIMDNRKMQDKTILLVHGKKTKFEELVELTATKNYYIHFPKIYYYENENDLIYRASKLAAKEAYRLAMHEVKNRYASTNRKAFIKEEDKDIHGSA